MLPILVENTLHTVINYDWFISIIQILTFVSQDPRVQGKHFPEIRFSAEHKPCHEWGYQKNKSGKQSRTRLVLKISIAKAIKKIEVSLSSCYNFPVVLYSF